MNQKAGRPREPVSSSLRVMSEIEAAYVSALIDTDGCVSCDGGRYWRIEFTNTEVELIATILRLTGVGRVYHRNRQGNACWDWGVYRISDVIALMKQLQPFSLKIQRVLEKVNAKTP